MSQGKGGTRKQPASSPSAPINYSFGMGPNFLYTQTLVYAGQNKLASARKQRVSPKKVGMSPVSVCGIRYRQIYQVQQHGHALCEGEEGPEQNQCVQTDAEYS